MSWPRIEDEEPLPELPPAEEADGEADESATPVEYDEVDATDPLDDALASLGEDGLEFDLTELAADRLPLEEEAEPELAPDEAFGAELPVFTLGADLEGPGAPDDDDDDDVPDLLGDRAIDQGEEGPTEDDDELNADDLPELDADDEGELDDAVLYERAALATEALPRELPWADEAWGVRLLAEGSFCRVTLAGQRVVAHLQGEPGGAVALDRSVAAARGGATPVLTPLEAVASPPEEPAQVAQVVQVVQVARGVGGCEDLWVSADDDSGELTLLSLASSASPRQLPALPHDQVPSEVAARDGLVALRVDDVGLYQVLPGAQASATRLDATRAASAFTVVGAEGARLPVVVSAHAEPGRVTLVAHGLDGPRIVGALEAREALGLGAEREGAALAYDPEGECVYIATCFGLFAAWRPPRAA